MMASTFPGQALGLDQLSFWKELSGFNSSVGMIQEKAEVNA